MIWHITNIRRFSQIIKSVYFASLDFPSDSLLHPHRVSSRSRSLAFCTVMYLPIQSRRVGWCLVAWLVVVGLGTASDDVYDLWSRLLLFMYTTRPPQPRWLSSVYPSNSFNHCLNPNLPMFPRWKETLVVLAGRKYTWLTVGRSDVHVAKYPGHCYIVNLPVGVHVHVHVPYTLIFICHHGHLSN